MTGVATINLCLKRGSNRAELGKVMSYLERAPSLRSKGGLESFSLGQPLSIMTTLTCETADSEMTQKTRPISWLRAALKEFETFPGGHPAEQISADQELNDHEFNGLFLRVPS
jgi:hypothetical protein